MTAPFITTTAYIDDKKMKVRTINRTGATKGQVEFIKSLWSDRELEKFIDICNLLKISDPMQDIPLNSENEIKFVRAFYPEFDPAQNIALIMREVDRANGFPCFLIEAWKLVSQQH